ncbi:MAG: GGDEF domain-containing protein, partial [Candidatus Brocadiaceae bacterium]
MGLVWQESDTEEEQVTRRIHRASRRTVLTSFVLAILLLFLALILARKGVESLGLRVLGWALFAWSLVVAIYAGYGYWQARTYYRRKSSELGLTDNLTGLPNRKGLVAALERFELGPQEFGKRTRLVDIDLANLNRVNYEFGQTVGDAVLQDIANLLRSGVPEDNIVGRLGGDEFLIVLPQASVSEAEALAESFKQTIADYSLSLGDRGEVHSLKARVSVASYVPEQASLHETVVSAKEATAHGRLPEAEDEEAEPYYHVPRITLGAFAARRWQSLNKSEQEEFKLWKRELNENVTDRMCSDIVKMLDEKAETNWCDFVTAVP